MNKEEKKRITSNITFLKERLGYLDPIIDRLVDKNVISPEQRDRIEKVNPPSPHKKFNEFIQCVLGSSEPTAFMGLLQALEEERFFNIVEKLQKDGRATNTRAASSYARETTNMTFRSPSAIQPQRREQAAMITQQHTPRMHSDAAITQTHHERIPPPPTPSATYDPVMGAAAAASASFDAGMSSRHSTPVQDRMTPFNMDRMTTAIGQMFAEFSGKVTNDLLDGFERRRYEERMEIELSMEKKISNEIERRMDNKLNCFKVDWEDQKQKLIDRNENALLSLQDSVDQLRNQTDAYNQLKQKYDQLQHVHGQMRDKENERWQKLSVINKENQQIKSELENAHEDINELKERIDELDSDNKALKDNEIQDSHKINHLMAEKEDLLLELERSEREKVDLRMRVDSLSHEIERLLTQQQDRANKDDKAYQEALKKQNERLDELYKVVQALTERERQSKTLFIGGNAVQKSARVPRPKN